ncbi:MAG: hypothetical protein HYZ75_01310 [Elusimicrobia bacterium]|nr:hypothetical protein [Elusimicrobiota bacterium]
MVERLPGRVRRQCSPDLLVQKGKAPAVISQTAERFDLTVLVVHKKGILSDALFGTTADQVLRSVRLRS